MDLDHWSETRGVLDAEGWGWGGKRRHVRGRRMFYGFNLSRALRGEIGSILLFSFIFVGLSFFLRSLDVGSRGTGNGAQVRDWMIDDGFRRIYGYFVPRRERILSPAREEQTRNTWLPFATSFLKFTIRE